MFSTEERFVLDTFLLFNYVKKWNKIKKKGTRILSFIVCPYFRLIRKLKCVLGRH